MNSMKNIFAALTLMVPFIVSAETPYEACARTEGINAEFYHAKHVGLFDSYAKDLHNSTRRKLETLSGEFRSDKTYMNTLIELAETDVETAADILSKKIRTGEKPFNVLRDFEKEHGKLMFKKNGEGASVSWSDKKELKIELCKVQDNIGEDIEKEGTAWLQHGIRICTFLIIAPRKMADGGYKFFNRMNKRYNLAPIPDRKVIYGNSVTLLRTVDQYKGIPIMPLEEYRPKRIEEKCGIEPKQADYAMVNFDERGNTKEASISQNELVRSPNEKSTAVHQ